MSRLPVVSPLERALFLKAHPFLQTLPPSSIAALAAHTVERVFARGEQVYEAGRPPDQVYFIGTGVIRIDFPDAPPMDADAPGGVGLVELFAKSAHPPAAHALEETLTLAMDTRTMLQLMEDDFVLYSTLVRGAGAATLDALTACGPERPPERGFPGDAALQTFAILDLVQRLAQAREAPLFEGSNLTALTELLRFQKLRTLPEGGRLWEQGDPVESLALIVDGAFVSEAGCGDTLHPAGSVLGAWELFSQDLRRESARATAPARIIEVDRTLFVDVLEDHFEFAVDYLGKLCRRLIEVRKSRDLNANC